MMVLGEGAVSYERGTPLWWQEHIGGTFINAIETLKTL